MIGFGRLKELQLGVLLFGSAVVVGSSSSANSIAFDENRRDWPRFFFVVSASLI